ncbi:hypothetical protein PFICI_11808 [Pestalotiopsis fici W106-1]|uniref:Uncharacterized protein n=1 Tax=Pestalotiopsis fici (strain W106-1 / CGMCC3.15140) TaxID=1229662 RepID=W3WU92_PESFW|nr:uncharacterized protein PFICI_11808 [Pestalotiopsis fici W106-1]ETS76421.1 hypothetical protein PFICI_11808 [Pestalotiopsis fici W106-1]
MVADAVPSITNGQEQSVLDACSSGDIVALQKLFNIHGIEPGSKPIITQCLYGTWSRVESRSIPSCMIPTTMELLENAVAAKQLAMVEFIFETYPLFDLSEGQCVASAVMEHPDAAILKRICDHQRAFASISMDDHLHTFFTRACEKPPDHIAPVLNILLDYDADISDGWGGLGALWAAISRGHSVEVIEKVLKCHLSQHVPIRSSHAETAIGRGDEDIVALIFSNDQMEFKANQSARYVEQADKTGDKAITAIVQQWVNKKSKQHLSAPRPWLTRTWQKLLRSGP